MAVNTSPVKVRGQSRFTEFESSQERLPYWARSTNPIVRRHLGLYWRTIPPQAGPFLVIFLGWTVILAVGVIFPPFLSITMITYLASIMILPVAMVLYGHVLLTIAIDAARAMQLEFSNNTFQLLQATPMSLSQIFLGKVAAAMWRRMDDIVMIAQLALAFTPPVAFTIYADFFSTSENPVFVAPLLTLIAALVTLARIFLEPLMIGVVSVFIGMVVPGKGRAISSAIVIGAFYFLLINLLSRLPSVRGFESPEGPVAANNILVIVTDFVVPVLAPIIIIFGILKIAESMLAQD